MVRVGLIGYGYWGPNLARNFHRCPGAALVRIVDLDARRLEAARSDWPGVDVATSLDEVTRADDIDAVAIATPVGTHYPLALDAIEHGKHVLVEKPMADSVKRSEHLIAEAARRRVVLLVDHTFVYTDAVRWMRDFVAAGKLGELYYLDSIRTNLGLFQRDVSVLWDLAPHDLSVLKEVIGRPVQAVTAMGACHAGSRVPDIAYATLDLGDGCLAHFHVSWLSPVKVRRMLIGGSKRMIVYDDLDAREKIKVYDSGVSIEHQDVEGQRRMMVQYRAGDMFSPALSSQEALKTEVEHFVRCITRGEKPRTGGEAGLAVVRILEAAQQSLSLGGKRVAL
jgi:predicted dehydrogenase